MAPSEQSLEIDGPEGPLVARAIGVARAEHAVVIVPGSGPTDMDGNGPVGALQTNSYKMLADALAGVGIASLRIDKRGMFASAAALADGNDVTVADYAEDVRAWVEKATDLAPNVWIAGHSEGGLVALVAAHAPPGPLAGLILLATAGRPVADILLEQLGAIPAARGVMEDIEAVLLALKAGGTVDPDAMPEVLQQMLPSAVHPYMADLCSYDPVEVAKAGAGPALIVQGDADIQVAPGDADRLRSALPQAVQKLLPGMTHTLKTDVPGQPLATYKDPDLPLHPKLVPAIVAFINASGPREER